MTVSSYSSKLVKTVYQLLVHISRRMVSTCTPLTDVYIGGTPYTPLTDVYIGTPYTPLTDAYIGTPYTPLTDAYIGTPYTPLTDAYIGTPYTPLTDAYIGGTPCTPLTDAHISTLYSMSQALIAYSHNNTQRSIYTSCHSVSRQHRDFIGGTLFSLNFQT